MIREVNARPTAANVPSSILKRLRRVSLSFPEAYEEPAWVGVRWRVRARTFAHVLTIVGGKPQAHARAAGTAGPATALMFRAPDEDAVAFREMGRPFFFGGWGRDVVGLLLDDRTDWSEVTELLTESYCLMAPTKLAAQVGLP
jgi:YjbR protein